MFSCHRHGSSSAERCTRISPWREAEAATAAEAAGREAAEAAAVAARRDVAAARQEAAVTMAVWLTLVHFSAQLEPFLTQNTPYTPRNTP